jgi:hypothetical protein
MYIYFKKNLMKKEEVGAFPADYKKNMEMAPLIIGSNPPIMEWIL